jgi:hypothetical protein
MINISLLATTAQEVIYNITFKKLKTGLNYNKIQNPDIFRFLLIEWMTYVTLELVGMI